MDEIKVLINNKLNNAFSGREDYLEIKKKYKIGNEDFIILMPSEDMEVNLYVLLYLSQFKERHSDSKIFILTDQRMVLKLHQVTESNHLSEIIEIPNNQMQNLIDLYTLYQFTDKLIIASLDLPKGRTIKNLVGKKNITKEEIVSIAILRNREFVKAEFKYDGNDMELLRFYNTLMKGN